jgi:uncharacterized protein (TIGR02328 family)
VLPKVRAEKERKIIMRLWSWQILSSLPDMQLKGQWRECCLIADGLAKNGTPNHLLVNRVTEYSSDHFYTYCILVWSEMQKRKFKTTTQSECRVFDIAGKVVGDIFGDWHNNEYLRVCMANLYEKHFFGVGKSRITDAEWERLCEGYRNITNEEWVL